MPDWTIVIPVKGTPSAKSRLGGPGDLRAARARAIALDTVEVAVSVAPVIVVTSGQHSADFEALGAAIIPEVGAGLAAAIQTGINSLPASASVAVLLGDLPALVADELRAALDAAAAHDLAFVPDREGTGTALITALVGSDHAPAFGEGSAARHAAAGYVELELDPENGLRNDVDTSEQLARLAGRTGPRTAALQS